MVFKRDVEEFNLGQMGVYTGSIMNEAGYDARPTISAPSAPSARAMPMRVRGPATAEEADAKFLGLLTLAVAAGIGWWDYSSGLALDWWGHALLIGVPAVAVGAVLRRLPRLVRVLRIATGVTLVAGLIVLGVLILRGG